MHPELGLTNQFEQEQLENCLVKIKMCYPWRMLEKAHVTGSCPLFLSVFFLHVCNQFILTMFSWAGNMHSNFTSLFTCDTSCHRAFTLVIYTEFNHYIYTGVAVGAFENDVEALAT